MKETEIEKLKRLRLPKITGTWDEIIKKVNTFGNERRFYKSSNGFLIRFKGVTKPDFYTTYYYTKENIGKLYLRKRNNCFMEPGDCGSISLSDRDHYLWELVEIPVDCGVDIVKISNTHNIKFADRQQHEYY